MRLNRDNLYIHTPIKGLLERLDEFVSQRLNSEIYINSSWLDKPCAGDIEIINNAFDRHGLSKIVHGPFLDLNPGSADTKIRIASLERFLDTIGYAVMLKAKSIVFHSHFEPIFYVKHLEAWLKNADEVWQKVCDRAKQNNVSIYIENSLDANPCAVLALLKAHPYLKACFDVAHYNVFSKGGWKEAIMQYPLGSIHELHISDNNGNEDTHLALGEGSIQFEELFAQINIRKGNPLLTIEPHSAEDLKKSLAYIRRFMDEG